MQMDITEQTPATPNLTGFSEENQILTLLKVSRRTLKNWRDRGLIPFIRLPGGRRILYHWPSVERAILRMQRGGGE